ncbi:MAG TPA: hypothetical protein VNT30_04005 [Stellaceae bacterium]|nr:hypothetical protein [Stellaceae bacterium]
MRPRAAMFVLILSATTLGGCVAYPAYPTAAYPTASTQPVARAMPTNCREEQHTITIDGKPQQAYSTVCQQPDGTWRLGNQETTAPSQTVVVQEAVPYYAYPSYYGYYPYYYEPGLSIGFGGRFGHHWHH